MKFFSRKGPYTDKLISIASADFSITYNALKLFIKKSVTLVPVNFRCDCRKAFDIEITNLVEKNIVGNVPFSLLMLDIDNFKISTTHTVIRQEIACL